MTPSRFEEILNAYGADAKRWPEREREEAQRFAATHGKALASARALDRALDAHTAPINVDTFTARAMASFANGDAKVVALPRRRSMAPAWVLAACALIGVAIGFGMGQVAPTDAAYQTLAGAFGSGSSDSSSEETGG